MSVKRYTIASLAGDGVGPELVAESTRLVAAVARLHGFVVDDVHPAFGGEAFVRHGHPLPRSTRDACLAADAVLVGAPRDPALEHLAAELDLRARVTWSRGRGGVDVLVVSPTDDASGSWAAERAFELARRRRGRIASVGDAAWSATAAAAAEAHDGVEHEHLGVASGLTALAFDRGRFDVVVAPRVVAEALADVAGSTEQGPAVVAEGRLAAHGPGLFWPVHGPARAIAGQGVANPSSMLLAAALLLGVGLREEGAASTLCGAVLHALGNGAVPPDVSERRVGATTRDFTSVVLHELPHSMTNAEFYREAVA